VVAYTLVTREATTPSDGTFGSGQTKFYTDVYAARFNSQGSRLATLPVATTAANEYAPTVALDGQDNFVVAYTSGGSYGAYDPADGIRTVRARYYSSANNSLLNPVPLGVDYFPYQYREDYTPTVALNANGQAVFAWENRGQKASGDLTGRGVFVETARVSPFQVAASLPAGVTEIQLTNAVSVDLSVDISRDPGFNGPVDLSIAGSLPGGVSWALRPSLSSLPGGSDHRVIRFTGASDLSVDGVFQVTLQARSGSLPVETIPLTVRVTAGHVTNVGPSPGAPAKTLVPGTTIWMSGAGFVSGSKVQFGNPGQDLPALQATPMFISRDGTSMEVVVPAGAVTGQVLVRTPAGGRLLSPDTYTIAAGGVTRFTPTEGSAPEMLLPGTTVTIYGFGFGAGTKIQFGNPNGNSPEIQVSPTFVTSDTMTVQVPRFAVDGPLKIIQPSGASFQSAQTFTVHNYRNTNGFSFANFSNNTVTISKVEELFTEDATHGVFGELTLNARLFAGRASDLLDNKGACFGMALASLRLSHGQEPIGHYALTAGAKTSTVFDLDFTSGGPLFHYIEVQHIAQLSKVMEDYDSDWLKNSHSPAQVQSLLTNALRSYDLPIISVLGPPGTVGHAVVAYDLEPGTVAGSYIIDIYDPDRPWSTAENSLSTHEQNEAVNGRIIVSANGTWTFVGAPSPYLLQGDLSHMIVTPYSQIPVHPDSLPPFLENLYLYVVGTSSPAPASGLTPAGLAAPHTEALMGSMSLTPVLAAPRAGVADLVGEAHAVHTDQARGPAQDTVWSSDWEPDWLAALPQ
jgi:hypothetical protein